MTRQVTRKETINLKRFYEPTQLLAAVLFGALSASCSIIDDDLSNCGADAEVNYELRLVTNINTELHTLPSTKNGLQMAEALRQHLSTIFTDHANDVDLAFYDTTVDSALVHHEQHIMDASQQSYTLYLPVREYQHLAVANTAGNAMVFLNGTDRCHTSSLGASSSFSSFDADTIGSHTTGLFTARQHMEVLQQASQTFHANLYMANCAAALVLDPRGHNTHDMQVVSTGFATAFNVCDSSYVFATKTPIVRTTRLQTDSLLAFCSVNFPSRNPSTRTIIETEAPFRYDESQQTLWQMRVYAPAADGSITETILNLHQPLCAGQLTIIRGWLADDGSVHTSDSHVGVSITLKWNENPFPDIPL